MIRLDKALAGAFFLTRSQAQQAAKAGRVAVDGQVCRDPAAKIHENCTLTLDGAPGAYEKYLYLMMNKPAGYLSATEDKRDPTVMELLPEEYRARPLAIVGRLDKDTTGLLILTDDGELNHRLTSPRYHLDKVYYACLDMPATQADIAAFAGGLELGDFTAMPSLLQIDPGDPRRCTVTVGEGKFHQVKRMFEKCGKQVVRLHRHAMGTLVLDENLAAGETRTLLPEEKALLYAACGMPQ